MSDSDETVCIHESCPRSFDTEIGMKVHYTLTHDDPAPWVENRKYVSSDEYYLKCVGEKGRECMVCDDGGEVCVHHIDGDRHNNDLENLVPVCWRCHSKMHRGSDGYEEWYEQMRPEARIG